MKTAQKNVFPGGIEQSLKNPFQKMAKAKKK